MVTDFTTKLGHALKHDFPDTALTLEDDVCIATMATAASILHRLLTEGATDEMVANIRRVQKARMEFHDACTDKGPMLFDDKDVFNAMLQKAVEG